MLLFEWSPQDILLCIIPLKEYSKGARKWARAHLVSKQLGVPPPLLNKAELLTVYLSGANVYTSKCDEESRVLL